MIKIMTHDELAEKKHELLYVLVLRSNSWPSGKLFHVRDLVPEPEVWLSWKKENMGVVLWLGKRFYEHQERKSTFMGLDPALNDGAATYMN